MEYKRFTIQILGTADSVDALTLHAAIETALNGIDKCRVKAVNLDMWVDGFTGEPRVFDEKGKEILKASEEVVEDTAVEPPIDNAVSDESTVDVMIPEEPKAE